MNTLTACPHCSALLDEDPFCAICGKSPLEEVITPEPAREERGAVDRRRLLTNAVSVIGTIAVLVLIWVWTHPADPVYVAAQLPTPTPTEAPIRSDSTAPSVDTTGGRVGSAPLTPTEGPEAIGSLSPWEDAPVIDLSTGAPIGGADYEDARAIVASLLEAVPEPWTLGEPRLALLDDPTIDRAAIEATQPIAARSFGLTGAEPLGDLWIIASSPDDPVGTAYLAALRRHPAVSAREVLVEEATTPAEVVVITDGADPGLVDDFLRNWQITATLQLA